MGARLEGEGVGRAARKNRLAGDSKWPSGRPAESIHIRPYFFIKSPCFGKILSMAALLTTTPFTFGQAKAITTGLFGAALSSSHRFSPSIITVTMFWSFMLSFTLAKYIHSPDFGLYFAMVPRT